MSAAAQSRMRPVRPVPTSAYTLRRSLALGNGADGAQRVGEHS